MRRSRERRWGRFGREAFAFAIMVTVECTNVGQSTIYKSAVTAGLSHRVFMVYSYAVSAILLLPVSLLFYRNKALPPLNFLWVAKFFLLGAMGFAAQYFGYKGIAYSNPTLGSAMSNIVPAATFFLAVLLRMETLNIKSWISQVKIVGTLVSIAGAIVVVLYRGPILIDPHTDKGLEMTALNGDRSDWITGGTMLALSYAIVSVWYILQAKFVREYPAELLVVFFYNLFACLLSLPFFLPSETNAAAWRVPADIRLWSILYAGVIGSGFGVCVHTWGLHVKGPVYVALFRPLSIVIAAVAGVILLNDSLYLGCVIGSVVISVGFYLVIWGKAVEIQDDESEATADADADADADTPLLSDSRSPPSA